MAINKVIYYGETLIDLTGDTVSKEHVDSGYWFTDKAGVRAQGTSTKDSNTSDDTANVSEILDGKTAHARGTLLTGTMPNRGAVSGSISTKAGSYTVPQGYHDGSGKVSIASEAVSQLVAENIREGCVVLGITGTMSEGAAESSQSNKNVTPSTSQQVVTPDSGYTCLRQVTVAAIPYTSANNSAGGQTITIG